MIFDNLRKYSIAYLVAIGGVLLTCLSSWNVRQELQSSHYREFEWAAGDRIQAVRLTVDQGLDALLEVREIYHAARSIKELEFRVLTDTLLKRRGYIHSLFWATWTPSEQGRGGARLPRQDLPDAGHERLRPGRVVEDRVGAHQSGHNSGVVHS
ncbi:MAG TPA: hypothetical protein PLX65_15255, partial [Accumulibacter sp.]|nr:hypothetical protein [Accumulibacter sp.]